MSRTIAILALSFLAVSFPVGADEVADTQPDLRLEELSVGGLYCLRGTGNPRFVMVVKILAVEPGIVHARSFDGSFKQCPSASDQATLSGQLTDFPINPKGFLASRPMLIVQIPVTEDELEAVARTNATLAKWREEGKK
jgi:hypothetical protein